MATALPDKKEKDTMKCKPVILTILLTGLLSAGNSPLAGQWKEDETVRQSMTVLNEIMSIPANGIPVAMLRDAHAVAIIPKVIKGSFVIGARHGTGVLLIRDSRGGWHAPVFISLTGGNIGWQVGVQSTDVVLVFKNQNSVNGLLSGKFTLGADAAVAAGPLGRQASAATDGQLNAEIYSWSRSRGLFLGVSLDGSVIELDQLAIANYYRPAIPGGQPAVPEAAQQLAMQVVQYTGVQSPLPPTAQVLPASTAQPQPTPAEQFSRNKAVFVRDELAKFARELYKKLDTDWQGYLALPAEIFQGNGHPSIQILNESLSRFESVRTDPQYAALANDPGFQSTYGLLKQYVEELTQSGQPFHLPSPPTSDR
jgi:lipid-binding SYLF domain-containing protein